MLTAIREEFAPENDQAFLRTAQAFMTLRLHSLSLEAVEMYIREFKELDLRLKNRKVPFPPQLASAAIINALPSSFRQLRISINVSHAKSIPPPNEIFELIRAEALASPSSAGHVAAAAPNIGIWSLRFNR
jgi:hypothetical protein